MKLTGTGVLAVAGVAAVVLLVVVYAPGVKAAIKNLALPSGQSPLANPVSRALGAWWSTIFKSRAEREVDAMLRTPTKKKVVTPADLAKTSRYFDNSGSLIH